MERLSDVRAVCFDWGGTLMSEDGPDDLPMGLWPTVQAIPGAAECLTSLEGHVPLCIATNASVSRKPMIEVALGRVGLARFFREIFCYAELGYKKNQPEFWQAVAAQLGFPLHRIAMIGDSLEHDCVAPRSFGVQAVWFNEDGKRRAPDVAVPVVTRLEQFASRVKNAA
ncbi:MULTISPECIES: HAD family hydrolase [Sorangium]|uniref:HAD family hydrolase n=1 Tax=Sorangium TaxID=39643 RepID=UPI003D9C4F81